VLVLELVGDERAPPLMAMHQSLVLKELYSLPDCDASHFEFALELFERRNLLPDLPLAGFNSPPQC
jgi:hypothetical protein